ncbi:hypothetical protein KXD40_007855 [Peronospora effusa]|uniref:Uncharacterized protein n=1 Tax=Peronospora effusa TaxID=542832 RepID=A0A3M6VR82_9STRA|nr:hypothetical protein DD238_002809 [Peronospora effusa]RQM12086.1 hypothetical protein DD237_007366 [Peronospora effusa]UIZ23622.1 hypothetical protein KXD40_007855 [Peronospora effusa]
MLPRPMRRLFSKRVFRLKTVENEASNTASSQQLPTKKTPDDSEINPLSHFAAFTSMENYVNVTLIQYNKKKEDKNPSKSPQIT